MNRWVRVKKGFIKPINQPLVDSNRMTKPLYDFYDERRELDLQFAEYLRGKRIAIVGKGVREDTTDGDFIDSFDVVARIHWPIPYHADILPGQRSEDKPGHKWDPPPFVPEKWQPVVGKKTHVFYTSIKEAGANWCRSIADTFRNEGGKFICEWHPSGAAGTNRSRRLLGYHPVRQLPREIFYHFWQVLGTEPLGGLVTLADICRHEVNSVYLTGMQCFVSDEYPDGITPGRPDNDVVPYDNFEWIRAFVRNHRDRVTIDDYMNYVFNKY